MIGRRWWVPWLWLAPALLLLGVFLVYPSIDTFRRSLLDRRSESFVGLDNYRYIIENPQPLVADTHGALLNNLLWIVMFTTITVGLGLILAVLSGRVRYEAVAKSAIFIPMAISFVAASVIWRFMFEFNPNVGMVNAVVTGLGGEPTAWLQHTGAPQTWLTQVGPGQPAEAVPAEYDRPDPRWGVDVDRVRDGRALCGAQGHLLRDARGGPRRWRE